MDDQENCAREAERLSAENSQLLLRLKEIAKTCRAAIERLPNVEMDKNGVAFVLSHIELIALKTPHHSATTEGSGNG